MKKNLTERAKNGRNGEQLIYVIDRIKYSCLATDENMKFESDADALQFFFNVFNEEYNCQNTKWLYPNLQERISEYLKGLPSCCNIDFVDYDIMNLGVKWGVLSSTDDKKGINFLKNFFSVCAFRIIQAATKVGLNPYKY